MMVYKFPTRYNYGKVTYTEGVTPVVGSHDCLIRVSSAHPNTTPRQTHQTALYVDYLFDYNHLDAKDEYFV